MNIRQRGGAATNTFSCGRWCTRRLPRSTFAGDRGERRLPPSILQRQQARVAARGGGVDGEGALGREAQEIMRTAGLGAGTGKVLAAERLHADHRTDLVAVDVDVADFRAAPDVVHRFVDATVDAERQAK